MNKIIVENDEISFDNEIIDLEIITKKITINIKNKVTINELNINNITKEININVLDNSTLIYNKYNKDAKVDLRMNINIATHANFYGNMAFIAYNSNNLDITTNMQGNEIENILNIKGLTKKDGQFNIKIDGNVLKNTFNNKMKESISILSQNNKENNIYPNMLVGTSEVIADHLVTIASVNKNELFYLKCKGISEEHAIKLIEKGFITELFNDKNIKKVINS